MERKERKFNKVYTIGRVTGDADTITGKNGQEYRVVPVTLLNGWKCKAFVHTVPEIDSVVLIYAVAREKGMSYTAYSLDHQTREFLKSACADI